jgi:hypothetical protein
LVPARTDRYVEPVDTGPVVYRNPVIRHVIDADYSPFLVGHSNIWKSTIQSQNLSLPLVGLYLTFMISVYPMKRVTFWFGAPNQDVVPYIRSHINAVVIVSNIEAAVFEIEVFW